MKKLLLVVFVMTTVCFIGCEDTLENADPEISYLSVVPGEIYLGDEVTIECVASDADGDVLSYAWEEDGEAVPITTSSITAIADEAGSFHIVCTVTDGNGGEDSEFIDIVVMEQPFMDSWTLAALSFTCVDDELLVGTPPNATGSLTIDSDYTFTWSTTLIDDDEGTLAECLEEDISVFTFTATGTVEHDEDYLYFDVGEVEDWVFMWEVDEDGDLILVEIDDEDDTIFVFE